MSKEIKNLNDLIHVKNLQKDNSEFYKLFTEFFSSDNNLELKTEINNPLAWSILTTFKDFVEENGLKNSAKLLDTFIKLNFKYLISKNRKSREEIVSSLKNSSLSLDNENLEEKNSFDEL